MSERRSHIRFRTQGTALLKATDGTAVEVKASVQDLSFTGISVIADQAMQPGMLVTVEITDLTVLRGSFALGTGKVTRVTAVRKDNAEVFKTGVRFVTPDQPLLQRLLLVIRKPPPKVKNPIKTAAWTCKRNTVWL